MEQSTTTVVTTKKMMLSSSTPTSINTSNSINNDDNNRNRTFGLCGVVYLMYFMSLAVIQTYLSLFYKSKGFDGSQMGLLSSITPLTTFLVAPIWGIILDSNNSQNNNNRNHHHQQQQPPP